MAIYRNEKELELLKKFNVSFPIASADTNILLKALTKEINLYKNNQFRLWIILVTSSRSLLLSPTASH